MFTEVVGADIDTQILISEPGIHSMFVDQLDAGSIKIMREELVARHPDGYSLIVDDGLHVAEANLNSLDCLLPILKSGGVYVIEDLENTQLHHVLSEVCLRHPDLEWGLWLNRGRGIGSQLLVLRKR